jgi:signal transduction histidine kinase
MPLKIEPILLRECVVKAIEEAEDITISHDIMEGIVTKNNNITVNIGDVPNAIISDERRIRLVFVNLISNAIKFSDSDNRTVHVSVQQNTSTPTIDDVMQLKCSIADNGIGLSQEDTNKVFDVFWQKDQSPKKIYGGTGIK